jgi:hypothetical protein
MLHGSPACLQHKVFSAASLRIARTQPWLPGKCCDQSDDNLPPVCRIGLRSDFFLHFNQFEQIAGRNACAAAAAVSQSRDSRSATLRTVTMTTLFCYGVVSRDQPQTKLIIIHYFP